MLKSVFNKVISFIRGLRKRIFTGITLRWLLNVFGIVFIVVIIVQVLLCIFIKNFYFSNVESEMAVSAETTAKYFERYVYPQYKDFTTCAQLLVEDFDKKDSMEIQVSNLNGKIVYSSSGFSIGDVAITPDVVSARTGTSAHWTGRYAPSNERIISVSVPLYESSGEVCGTLRLISSIERVNSTLNTIYMIIILCGLCIVALTAGSGIYFIKSIVIPVGEINKIALEISKGNMTARIETNKANDEIGELCNSINIMAEELSTAEKMKNDFISQISHELRTPITAIRGWSETILADSSKMDETTKRGVEIINRETNRLSKMVEELLDMSRIQNGRIKLSAHPTDVLAEFEETVFMMSERAKSEQVNINYEGTDHLVMVMGDKDRLKQVFFNVIDNAIKHSNEGGRIEIRSDVKDDVLVLTIEDFGEGISREDLPHVKQMFYKGSSQKRGSGIGLGVSDEIVKLHGGTLDIESEIGIGTKVTIKLPVIKESEDEQNDTTAG